MMITYRIYVLWDPRVLGVEAVRYVGATCMSLSTKLKSHLRDAKYSSGNSPRVKWLRQLGEVGVKPGIEEIEMLRGSSKEAADREDAWMGYYRDQGCDLLNVRKGGGGLSRGTSSGPSAWAICKFEQVPDRVIAKHEGVSVGTVASWRRERGYISYSEQKKLFSSICPEVTIVASTWDEIVKERIHLETQGFPGCSVYEGWIYRLEESIKLTQGVELLRAEGLEEAIAAYCRSLLRELKGDMLLTGHEALMRLFGLWSRIQEEQRVLGDKVTLDDLNVWASQLVMHKRSINDVFQYDHVIDMHDRYIAKFREEQKGYNELRDLLKGGIALVKNCHWLCYDEEEESFNIFITDIGGYFPEYPVLEGTLQQCLEYLKQAQMPTT